MIEEKENYLKNLLTNESGIKILSERLNIIIEDKDFYKYGLLIPIVKKLIENGYSKVVLDNFNVILKNALRDETLDIVLMIINVPNGNNIISKNIDLIFSKLDGEELVNFIDLLDGDKKEKILKRNEFSYNLYKKGFIRSSTLGGIIKGDLSIFVEEIIKEVSNSRELKKLEPGTYNDVIETNGYVIKLGETRDKFEIPYHPNILQPLLRERITDKNGKDVLIVEVQDKVDTKNVTKEQRDELIKKLKEAKINCRDILYGNIGLLKKPNKRKLFNGVGGIIDNKDIEERTANPGEPVIFDTDMIEKDD